MRELVTPPDYQPTEERVEATKTSLLPYLFSQIDINDTFVDEVFEDQMGDKITRYTNWVSDLLSNTPDSIDAQYAASQAFFFAFQTCLHTLDHKTSPIADIGGYKKTITARLPQENHDVFTLRAAMRDMIVTDSDEYFAHNPTVSDLVFSYIDMIDPSGEHYAVARTIAGLTFLQIELGDEKQYIDTHLALYEQEIAS